MSWHHTADQWLGREDEPNDPGADYLEEVAPPCLDPARLGAPKCGLPNEEDVG